MDSICSRPVWYYSGPLPSDAIHSKVGALISVAPVIMLVHNRHRSGLMWMCSSPDSRVYWTPSPQRSACPSSSERWPPGTTHSPTPSSPARSRSSRSRSWIRGRARNRPPSPTRSRGSSPGPRTPGGRRWASGIFWRRGSGSTPGRGQSWYNK